MAEEYDFYEDQNSKMWEGSHHWQVVFMVDAPPPNALGLDAKGPVLIGRSNPQSSTLPDLDLSSYGASVNGISRRHAVLIPDADGLFLVDLGSTNGTWINGKFLNPGQKYMLAVNDQIEFGLLKISVRILAPITSSPESGFDTSVTRSKPDKSAG